MHKKLMKLSECNMLELLEKMFDDLKEYNMTEIYDKYMDEIDDIVYCIPDDKAKEIVKRMQPYGEMFSMDIVKNMLIANAVPCENKSVVRYYLCMNMYANDARQVAEENNMPLEKFCFIMAKTFINDIDACKHKVEKYFMDIVSE